jgi:CO/xanthine dehydrogenase Mo-binding subunit
MSAQAIGQALRREEDPRLLRGRGRYADDVHLPREARGYVLRSPHAHARIRAIDASAAHVVKHRTVSHRITTNSMEPRRSRDPSRSGPTPRTLFAVMCYGCSMTSKRARSSAMSPPSRASSVRSSSKSSQRSAPGQQTAAATPSRPRPQVGLLSNDLR